MKVPKKRKEICTFVAEIIKNAKDYEEDSRS